MSGRRNNGGGSDGGSIGLVGVIGASRGTGLQCVLYLAKKRIACRAIARDPAKCEQAVCAALPSALQKYGEYEDVRAL